MIILAVDPGSEYTAWVLYDTETEEILDKAKEGNKALINRIQNYNFPLCPEKLVIEKIQSYGMAVGATVFDTCIWIGRFIQEFEQWDEKILGTTSGWEYMFRSDVKLYICKTSRAKDANIRAALIDMYGAPGTKKNPGKTFGISKDIWAALAIAVSYKMRLEERAIQEKTRVT